MFALHNSDLVWLGLCSGAAEQVFKVQVTFCKMVVTPLLHLPGHAIAQAVSRCLLTTEACVCAHGSPCGIYGQSGTRTGFLLILCLSCQNHSTAAPYSLMHHLGAAQQAH
jgi:hypothetical protein